MSLYLEILRMAATNSTKVNTEEYLNQFNYASNTTYSLEHLMVLEQRDKITDYIKESTKLFEFTKSNFSKTMVKRITLHLLMHSKKGLRRALNTLSSLAASFARPAREFVDSLG